MYHSKNLEIHVIDHCNLDCVGCSHESPLMGRRFENPDRLGMALSVLWQFYRVPLLKLIGGEPLLHPDIDKIISIAKSRTSARLRLVTNGTLLERHCYRLHGVDEIHISSYPDVPISSDENIQSMAAKLCVPITIQAFQYFRWHRSLARNNPKLTQQIFATCQLYHSWECHTLRDGWFYACPSAATWASGNGEGIDLLAPGCDLEATIGQLLTRKVPLASCDACLGSVGQRFKHSIGWRTSHGSFPNSALDADFLDSLEVNGDAYNGCFEYKRTIHPSGHIELHGDGP